ncbi:Syntaxin-6 [Coemansia nantahalensis]|uniref:Syntaxin-6 n=1 Tax=Coemansia nantahalensis TaxID=2789366 RepID=A0ACC1JVX2_9FUNG|nr:Syntaxin-6 [Coemansia nantahalensis]KAJ2768349.1 Syntaxin-6 [Coemansia nantahalensis]
MSDPFVVVQEDVVSAFEQARSLLASWRALGGKRRSPQEENEFQYVTDELYSTLTSIGSDLNDLQETIDVARVAPAEYGLTSAQITERQAFVASKHKAVEDMRRTLTKPDSGRRGGNSSGNGGGGSSSGRNAGPASAGRSNAEFDGHQSQHQILIDQQDQQFDSMLDTVRNLHGIASTMNTELDTQAIMLGEVDTLMDRTQARLSSARKKVDKFLRDKSNRSIYVAVVLFAVILVLLMLIIFT